MENENFKQAWRIDSSHFVFQDERGLHWMGLIKDPWGKKRKGYYKMTGQIGIVKNTLILFPWKYSEAVSLTSFKRQRKEMKKFPLWGKTGKVQIWFAKISTRRKKVNKFPPKI